MELNRRSFLKKLGIGTAGVAAVSAGLNPLKAVEAKTGAGCYETIIGVDPGRVEKGYMSTVFRSKKEDLTDVIYNISPIETPMTRNYEWQTDSISTNADRLSQFEKDSLSRQIAIAGRKMREDMITHFNTKK
jgi:hypothetical protein